MTKICAIILAYNEEIILPYTLRHYKTFVDEIVVYDGMSTDRTRDICREYGAKIVDWKTDGLNDTLAMDVKNQAWKNMLFADWVFTLDADEIFYFPKGARETLAEYDRQEVAVVKPSGFEMFSETLPTTTGQIYDEIQWGGVDDFWYAKPVLFSPKRVAETNFAAGAHTCTPKLKNGTLMPNPTVPNDPPAYLLHYHQIGSLERLAAKYDATRARLSAANVKNQHGNFDPGMKHAIDKRNLIMRTFRKVV